MRFRTLIFAAVGLGACAAKESPPVPAPKPVATTNLPVDEASRPLTQDECRSLAQWMVAACDDRGNDRSAQVDSWCGDLVRRAAGGEDAWVSGDCVPFIKYMDAVCLRSTTSVRAIMDCDRNVDRSR